MRVVGVEVPIAPAWAGLIAESSVIVVVDRLTAATLSGRRGVDQLAVRDRTARDTSPAERR